MLFLEIFLSIHVLILLSSWLIGTSWLVNQPSFKLKLARILLVSCVIAPVVVHCFSDIEKSVRPHYESLDAMQEYVNQPIIKQQSFIPQSAPASVVSSISYSQLVYVLFGLLILFRVYRLLVGIGNLREMLGEAIPYRTAGKLIIKVSHQCHIPFSVNFFYKAYILLPVSLFSSAKNIKIAIAHEGQHHRNGDCLWAYFTESLRIIFFGNPGLTRWCRVLSELQEFSCDEVLVGRPKISAHDYGRCLLDVVQTVSQSSLSASREFACTVGMALNQENEDRTLIIRRISMLSTYPLCVSKSLLKGITCAVFAIAAPICVAYSAVGTLANPKAPEVDMSHLDSKMQQLAHQEISNAVTQYHAKSGVIAIADPTTGNIVAFAEAGNNKEKSWKSRIFSPGSTIKPFIAAAAIDSGNSAATKVYDCHSPYQIAGKTFTNYNSNIGSVTLKDAIAKSNNVCLIKVSQETGAPLIRKKLTEFGFDTNAWWQTNQNEQLQLAMTSLGENIPVTIESLAKSYAILANKGQQFDPKAVPAVSTETTDAVTHMLENAVTNGTGKLAAIPGIAVAGKTGTVVENNKAAQSKHLALFAGYVPANAPRYVILVVIEEGYLNKNNDTLTTGGELAAPVFRSVALNSLNSTN